MRSHHRTAALLNMVLSCVICSIAVNWIALPNGFVVTGITGLAMTAETFTGINYALIYYGLTLAILLFTAVTLGYKEVSSILFLSILYPLVLWVLNHVQVEIILKEKLIAVMFFGVVIGGYSQADKIQLDCVCNSREYVQLREFIRDSGIDCFIKVFPLTHVFGRSKDFHRLSDQNL